MDLLSGIRNAPRPVMLSPDQSEGDVADIPFFPNPWIEEERLRKAEEKRRGRAEEEKARQAEAEQLLRANKEAHADQAEEKLAPEAAMQLGKHLYTYHGHTNWVNSVAWSPDRTRIASADKNGDVRVWEPIPDGEVIRYQGFSGLITALAWSPAGNQIAVACADGIVQVWQTT